MRTFLAAAAIGASMLTTAAAAWRAGDELLSLEGEALITAADAMRTGAEEKLAPAELVAVSARLAAVTSHLPRAHKDRRVFGRYFEKACGKATGAELPQLLDIYVAIDPAHFDKEHLLAPLATAWVMDHLAARTDRGAVELPPLEQTIPPPKLADAPPELLAAWQLFRRATQAFDATYRRGTGREQAVSFQMNERAFYRLIDEVLQRRGERAAEQLANFAWSGMCGTGSDSLTGPQEIGVWLALLQEGRTAEAIGAAVRLEGHERLISADGRQNARIEFLERCGLDWETLLAGAHLDGEAVGSMGGWFAAALQEVAAFGSDRGAMLMAQMARRAPPERREPYAFALATVISPKAANLSGGWSRPRLERHAEAAISTAARAHVIAALQELAAPDADPGVAAAAVAGLERAKAPEARATLHALLKHPSPEVTKKAAEALRALGETVDPPPAPTPVRFRFARNGTIVPAGTAIGWEIRSGETGRVSSGKNTDASGAIGLDRKYFTARDGAATTVIFTGARRDDPTDQPYFHVEVPVPQNLDAVTTVDIALTPVELRVDRLHAVTGEASGVKVEIQRAEPKREPGAPYVSSDPVRWKPEVALGQPVVLAMQPGTYALKVLCAGAARYTSTFTVGAEPTPVAVSLQPGGDVRFTIVRPDGETNASSSIRHAGQDVAGVHFDWETKTYAGLPAGQYVLHIPSSAEAYPASAGGRGLAPAVGYRARDVPFTITGTSGAAVELGEIRLEPAAQ